MGFNSGFKGLNKKRAAAAAAAVVMTITAVVTRTLSFSM